VDLGLEDGDGAGVDGCAQDGREFAKRRFVLGDAAQIVLVEIEGWRAADDGAGERLTGCDCENRE
jgi:hypothetical protein